MDWLKEYDRRNLDASDHLTAVETEEAFPSNLDCSSNNNSIDDVCDCNSMINLCFNNNDSASTRTGIG